MEKAGDLVPVRLSRRLVRFSTIQILAREQSGALADQASATNTNHANTHSTTTAR
jgi:hypothetical protein